jgi:hypothetical protein
MHARGASTVGHPLERVADLHDRSDDRQDTEDPLDPAKGGVRATPVEPLELRAEDQREAEQQEDHGDDRTRQHAVSPCLRHASSGTSAGRRRSSRPASTP